MLLGLCMGLFSLLLHSFVDFPLQIPAVGSLFVVFGALVCAARVEPSDAATRGHGGTGVRPVVLSMCAVALAVLAVLTLSTGWRDAKAQSALNEIGTEDGEPAIFAKTQAALNLAPRDPQIVKARGYWAAYLFDRTYVGDMDKIDSARRVLTAAESAFRRYVEILPCSSRGWWGLAEVYAKQSGVERMDEPIRLDALLPAREEDLRRPTRLALAACRTALRLEPSLSPVYDQMGRLYLDEGLREKALEAFKTSGWLLPSYDEHEWGPIPSLPEDVYRAISAGMESAVKRLDTDPGAIYKDLGGMAHLRKNFKDAEKYYRLGLASVRSKLWGDVLALVLGQLMRVEGREAEALPLLLRASGSPVVGWRAWIQIGELRSAKDDRAGAVEAFRAAQALAPAEVEPTIALARETARSGKREEAAGLLRYVIGRKPDVLYAREILVQVLREDGRNREALAEAEALLGRAPDSAVYKRMVEDLKRTPQGSAPPGDPR